MAGPPALLSAAMHATAAGKAHIATAERQGSGQTSVHLLSTAPMACPSRYQHMERGGRSRSTQEPLLPWHSRPSSHTAGYASLPWILSEHLSRQAYAYRRALKRCQALHLTQGRYFGTISTSTPGKRDGVFKVYSSCSYLTARKLLFEVSLVRFSNSMKAHMALSADEHQVTIQQSLEGRPECTTYHTRNG